MRNDFFPRPTTFLPLKQILCLSFCLLAFSACTSKSKMTSADTAAPAANSQAEDTSVAEAKQQAMQQQQETEKEILTTLAQLKEKPDQLKMYCKKVENTKRTHHFLFFERQAGQTWSAKVYTEFFNEQKKKIGTKSTVEFPVQRTDDIIQSTEELAKRQFYLEFPSINSIAEVKLRTRYQGDRTPQSFVPREKALSDVTCFEQY